MNKFENLKVGDVLRNNNWQITVLDVLTQTCIVELSSGSSEYFSFKELEINGYELVKPEWRVDVVGQEYWYLGSSGMACSVKWDNDNYDKFRLKSKNCFETEELAEAKYKEIMES